MAAFNVTVGTPVIFGFTEVDQNGTPLATPVAGTAVWSNSNSAAGTLAPSPSGQSATYTPVAPGTDTVTAVLTVGGQTFTATVTVNVAAAPQVLSGIVINEIPALV